MTNMHSKLITCSCQEFVHPWTDSCMRSLAGFTIHGTMNSLKMYTFVYTVAFLIKRRLPTLNDLKRTVMGICQSSAFLTFNGIAFIGGMCLWRKVFGAWSFGSSAFWPCLYGSAAAILIERPERRMLLTMYVANEACEAVWNMLKEKEVVKALPYGQVGLFSIGITGLFYMYKLGVHKSKFCRDPIFSLMRLLVGTSEEGPKKFEKQDQPPVESTTLNSNKYLNTYEKFRNCMNSKHSCCAHQDSCVKYSILGGLRPFIGGVSASLVLKLTFAMKKFSQPGTFKKVFNSKDTYKLGLFLGGFTFLYKSVSCGLRHVTGKDDPKHSIPASLIASLAAINYQNKFVALYVILKMVQLSYYKGIEEEKVPNIPQFVTVLYAVCTAILFHAAMMQPLALRDSYWKFLYNYSGARVALFNRDQVEKFGFNTQKAMQELIRRNGPFILRCSMT